MKEEEPMRRRKEGTKRMKRKQPGRVLERMETRARPGKKDRDGREREKRKGHQE